MRQFDIADEADRITYPTQSPCPSVFNPRFSPALIEQIASVLRFWHPFAGDAHQRATMRSGQLRTRREPSRQCDTSVMPRDAARRAASSVADLRDTRTGHPAR